jgi:hypothetical protein
MGCGLVGSANFKSRHRRRRAERYREEERGAAFLGAAGVYTAAVCFDDGATDCQPEANARYRGFLLSPGKFLEDRFLTPGRDASAIVRDANG